MYFIHNNNIKCIDFNQIHYVVNLNIVSFFYDF